MGEQSSSYILDNSYDFITRLLPGFFFLCHVALVVIYFPGLELIKDIALNRPVVFVFIFSIFSLLFGMLFEDWGSGVEDRLDSRPAARKGEYCERDVRKKTWHTYLKTTIENSPVGHRYLRTLVIRLKFALGMLVATGFSCLLLSWVAIVQFGAWGYGNNYQPIVFLLATFLELLFVFEFHTTAKETGDLLHETRELVLEGLDSAGKAIDKETLELEVPEVLSA